ncbi:hypothetical protein Vadar_006582 [Vaccinium darrowii]|uniref:Uncharacterized protein n=1 Tax=Vaccinium darrowii TaxID=229202 RepID=A0ACB7XXZ4_9ERIC|nr:hypothetical protein Vadar_006582 [Vaccinium darrowii]
MLGFEEDLERLIEKLGDGGKGKPLEIISIIGAGGSGKTTLARKVYDHPFTSHTFNIHAWITVSQDYDKTRKRDLLIRILKSVIQGNYDKSSDDKLGEDILKCLKGRKYLIVMDDIWDIEAWNAVESLRAPFSYLLNLETLNFKARFWNDTICLPCDIFKMVKLRHLYTKIGKFTFHHSSEEAGRIHFDHSSKLDSLQTLHQICACETCLSLLVRTPNIRKLGLDMIPEDDNVLRFPDLECFKCLKKLTFYVNGPRSNFEGTLPPGLKLPLTITHITLRYTGLKWEELSLLQTLPGLEVLKLMTFACWGPVWNTSELEGFPKLKHLKFDCLDIEEWNASEDQFPELEVLVLGRCNKLERIPNGFGNLNELREIKLVYCRRSVEESAKEIQQEQKNRKGDDDCLNLLAEYR